jgi:hypothetical protein
MTMIIENTIGPELVELEIPDGWCAMAAEAVASSARPANAEQGNLCIEILPIP